MTESVSPGNSSRKLLWKLAVGVLGRMRWEASWLMQEAWSRALAAPIKPQRFSPDMCVPECRGSRHPAPFLFNSSLEERRIFSFGLGGSGEFTEPNQPRVRASGTAALDASCPGGRDYTNSQRWDRVLTPPWSADSRAHSLGRMVCSGEGPTPS